MLGAVGDADPVDDKSAEEDHGDGEVGNADPVHDESAEEDPVAVAQGLLHRAYAYHALKLLPKTSNDIDLNNQWDAYENY